jgi:hypothetical protein
MGRLEPRILLLATIIVRAKEIEHEKSNADSRRLCSLLNSLTAGGSPKIAYSAPQEALLQEIL